MLIVHAFIGVFMKSVLVSVLFAAAVGVGQAQTPGEAPAPGSASLGASAAIMRGLESVSPVLVGADNKNVPLKWFNFKNNGMGGGDMAKQLGLSMVTLGFGGGAVMTMALPGTDSDIDAPAGMTKVLLNGYSQREMGQEGDIQIIKFDTDKSERIAKDKNGKWQSSYLKPGNKKAKFTKEDGVWVVKLSEPLAPGQYALVSAAGRMGCFDFSVR